MGLIAKHWGLSHTLAVVPVVAPPLTPLAMTGFLVGSLSNNPTEDPQNENVEDENNPKQPKPWWIILGGIITATGYILIGQFISRSVALSTLAYATISIFLIWRGKCWVWAPIAAALTSLIPKSPLTILGVIIGLQTLHCLKAPLPEGQYNRPEIPVSLALGTIIPGFNHTFFLSHLTGRSFPALSSWSGIWEWGAAFSMLLIGKADGKTTIGTLDPHMNPPSWLAAILAAALSPLLPSPQLKPLNKTLSLALPALCLLAFDPTALAWTLVTIALGMAYTPSSRWIIPAIASLPTLP